jgi:hypothetical protein
MGSFRCHDWAAVSRRVAGLIPRFKPGTWLGREPVWVAGDDGWADAAGAVSVVCPVTLDELLAEA